ncbi:MAG: hypothetical protein K2J93_06750 [Anaeroplasmataceae bacterium]|nr:hypothetical protein [Anaeroplasmataceae bacterium]
MKKEKIAIITLIVSMYLPQVFIEVLSILIRFMFNEKLFLSLFIVALVLMGISYIFGIINAIIAIVDIFRDVPSPTKLTMITKLVLIPWYIENFFVWLLMVGICANPWLMLAAPLVMCIGVGYTFSFLIFTNVHNFSYVIRLWRMKKLKLTSEIIIPIALHFIFVLDILGSILLHRALDKQIPADNECELVE